MFIPFHHIFQKKPFEKTEDFRQKQFSLRSSIIRLTVTAGILYFLITITILFYFSNRLLENTYQNIHQEMNLYSQKLTQSLSSVETGIINYTENNAQAGLLSTLSSRSETPVHQMRVHQIMDNILPFCPDIDGLFYYAPKTDVYIPCSLSSQDTCSSYLKQLMRSESEIQKINTENWFFVPYNHTNYLVRILKSHYCYMGAWTRLESLTSSFDALNSNGTQFLYIAPNGYAINNAEWGNYRFSVSESQNQTITIKDSHGKSYLQISYPLSFCDYHLVALIPREHLTSLMKPIYRFVMVLFLILLFISVVIFLIIRNFMAAPLASLQKISSLIHSQKQGTITIPSITGEHCKEVIEINNGITSLLEEITDLQSSVYEERIQKTEFELALLKSQISPHFLINCLSTIYSVSQSDDSGKVTQKMIQTLSEHLRYSLSSKQTVPLSEELYYVENYLELTGIRFPGCLSYSINVPAECRNACFFPVFLLTLAENTIKVNMIMGELLKIQISGSVVQDESGQPFVHLIYIDSGMGFDADSLVGLNNLHNELKNPVIDGGKIGLYNIVKRMDLLFDCRGSIHFSNEPDWGARIDIMVPYQIFKGEDTHLSEHIFS